MHSKQSYILWSVLLLVAYLQTSAFANALKGELVLSGKAPEAGLIYFADDKESSPKKVPTVNQKDRNFSEKLVVSSKGSDILFKNSDPYSHNIYADDSEARVKFDVGLMVPGGEVRQKVDWEDNIIKCGCKIHPTMKTWVASIASRYYKVLNFRPDDKTMTFEIADVPAQLSKVKVWFPNYPAQEFQIQRGESKQIDLERDGKSFGTLTLTR